MTFPYKVEPDENMRVFYAYFPDGHVETKGCDEAFQEPWTVKALPEGDELVEGSKKLSSSPSSSSLASTNACMCLGD